MSNATAAVVQQSLTIEAVQQIVPPGLRRGVTQDFVDRLNGFNNDPAFFEHYMGNLVSYESVLNGGRFKLTDYISAVEYVSRKLMGKSNFAAYSETFPERIESFKRNTIPSNQVHAYVAAYNANKLVTTLLQQAMIPIYVSHQHLLYKAIAIQVDIMDDPKVSPKVRSDTAHNLAVLLSPPKESKLQVEVGIHHSSALQDLNESIGKLVDMQVKAIEAKTITALDAAETRLVGSN